MQALKEAGIKKLIKYIFYIFILILFELCIFPSMRKIFLILLDAKIGKNTYIQNVKFINLYRSSFKNLKIGNYCFIGSETLLDVANKIIISDYVTIAIRTSVFTYINVGFKHHLLKKIISCYDKKSSY